MRPVGVGVAVARAVDVVSGDVGIRPFDAGGVAAQGIDGGGGGEGGEGEEGGAGEEHFDEYGRRSKPEVVEIE